MKLHLKNPIIVALDVDDPQKAMDIVHLLKDSVGAYKLGPRLLLKTGGSLIQKIAQVAPVFVDQKFYDIPSTMIPAVQACFDQKATFVTVHASSGLPALTQLALLEKKLQQKRRFHILSVTILTSFSSESLPGTMKDLPILDHVGILVDLSVQAGLDSIVCSPNEVAFIKKTYKDINIVTPGVRLQDSLQQKEDQIRITTPQKAMGYGASALVIGRPIIMANNPRDVLEQILNKITY